MNPPILSNITPPESISFWLLEEYRAVLATHVKAKYTNPTLPVPNP